MEGPESRKMATTTIIRSDRTLAVPSETLVISELNIVSGSENRAISI